MTGGGTGQNTVPAIPICTFWAARSEVGQRMTTTLRTLYVHMVLAGKVLLMGDNNSLLTKAIRHHPGTRECHQESSQR